MMSAEHNAERCQELLSLNVHARAAFARRQAILVNHTKWPIQHWYNDQDFCRAYNTAVQLADKVEELQAELKSERAKLKV